MVNESAKKRFDANKQTIREINVKNLAEAKRTGLYATIQSARTPNDDKNHDC